MIKIPQFLNELLTHLVIVTIAGYCMYSSFGNEGIIFYLIFITIAANIEAFTYKALFVKSLRAENQNKRTRNP